MPAKVRTLEEVKRELARRRGVTEIPMPIWEFLVKKGWGQAVVQGTKDMEWLYVQLEDLEEVHAGGANTSRSPQPRVIRKEIDPDHGAKALSSIMAMDAEKDPYLQEFRRLISYEGPVKSEGTGWPDMKREEARQQTGNPDVADSGHEARRRSGIPLEELGVTLAFHVKFFRKELNDHQLADYWTLIKGAFKYRVEEDETTALFHFQLCLTDVLSDRYGWPWGDTQNFILGGETPRLPLAWVQYKDRTDYPAAALVELRINPNMSPRDVMELYGGIRRQIKGSDSRYRPLEEGRATLAVFAFHSNDGRTWEDAIKTWNHENPKLRYEDSRSFTRDCRESYKRVTGLELEWKGNRRGKGGSSNA